MQGIIVENISNLYQVKTNNGIYETTARGKLKKDDIIPVVGDNVQILITDELNKKAVIENVQERNVYIKRPKLANITQIVFVVSSKDPKPDLLMLDKQLAYMEKLQIEPIIIINKIDLEETYKPIQELYTKVGYRTFITSAKQKIGIEELRVILRNKISVLSGNSGVGKSSLINALFHIDKTQEGEVSKKNKKGKNTTTDTKLYELEKNTYIADTPGFSSFEINEIESTELDTYFREFKAEIPKCEFIGCTHIKEQNCGVKEAVQADIISKERYERYCKIYEELKEKEKYKWQSLKK